MVTDKGYSRYVLHSTTDFQKSLRWFEVISRVNDVLYQILIQLATKLII